MRDFGALKVWIPIWSDVDVFDVWKEVDLVGDVSWRW